MRPFESFRELHVPFGCIQDANDTVNAAENTRWNHESLDHQNTVIMHDRRNRMSRNFLSCFTFDNSSHNEVLTVTKGNVTRDLRHQGLLRTANIMLSNAGRYLKAWRSPISYSSIE